MTKLITADECWMNFDSHSEPAKQIKAIQLNAAKWGMEQAAEAVGAASCCCGVEILRIADKLELPKD